MSKIGPLENRIVIVQGGQKEGNGEWVLNGYGVSFWVDEVAHDW